MKYTYLIGTVVLDLHGLIPGAVEKYVDDASGQHVIQGRVDPVHRPVGPVREPGIQVHVFARVFDGVSLRQLAEALPRDGVYLAARAVVDAHGVGGTRRRVPRGR